MGLKDEQTEQLWNLGGGGPSGDFAPAEERAGALFGAARMAAQTGIPTFYVEMKVAGLAELNATLGHSQADSAMAEARSKVHERLRAVVGEVQPLADRASSFGFLVSAARGSTNEAQLRQVAVSVAEAVGGSLGLSLSAEVTDADEAAATAVVADLSRQKTPKNAGPPEDAGQPRGRGPTARFTSSGSDRRAAFVTLATKFGIDARAAADLYGMLLQSRPDALTGFERGPDREATVLKATEYARSTGTPGVYAEIDVRNLGGLNRTLGRENADAVFVKVSTIAEAEMKSLGDLGDAWPFRHGGDEFSFVTVARRPGISAAQLEFAVGAALTRAAAKIKAATADVAQVPHAKVGGPPGTGITWGTSVIDGRAEPSEIFSVADRRVEQKKGGSRR